ncbi:histidine kinase [Actinomadura kijaniata]|uniref:histidine kinase n=1 Tax=Actinomadura namibiensis TaxID=182080 RepID=A0A7W3LSP0_ACTNM|nr:histidine kinase [Actinomadura namibiensis]MBA8953492.1 signal transduction histidine kinase [Actinomadura namibiensis]
MTRVAWERLVDAALAVLTAVAVVMGPAVVGATLTYEGTLAPAALLGGAMLFRRRHPVAVLTVSAAVMVGYRWAGLFEGGWLWPLTPALVSAAARGRVGWSAGIGAAVLLCGLPRELAGTSGVSETAARIGVEALWLALVLTGAVARRQYGRWRDEHEARLVDQERARLAEQRLEISREVHDVVAHTLAVVGVHLHVAADTLADSPEEARAALRTAMEVRGRAMRDLKAFVGDLRDGPAGLAEVPELLDRARAAGLTATLHREGDLDGVPAAQGVAAYRIVREAVTNTLRHAAAARLDVRLAARPGELRVEVTDDGAGPAAFAAGHGLTGMRERVAALDGTLDLTSGDGFTVRAALPVAGTAAGAAAERAGSPA